MQSKYYYYPNGEKSLETVVADYLEKRKKDKSLQFVVLADKNFLFDKSFRSRYDSIFGVLKSSNINPSNIEFAVDEEQRRFNASEWAQFREIDKFFSKQGVNFGFEDRYKIWGIQEVETANKKIVETADEIRKFDLSPYEKLLMSYLKVTSRKYVNEEEHEHSADSRSVFGVLNSDKIVCVGYAELLKAITEELGDENIQIYKNHVACSSDGKVIDGYHSNIIIHIKDEKYGINGFYYLDPTWDSGHENKNIPEISYFMVPLSDIDKIKDQIRGEWAGLPEEEIIQERRSAKRASPSWKTYNRENENNISFTSDGFQLTREFLQDCITIYPELATKLRDEIISTQYLDLVDRCDVCRGQQEYYKQLLDIISQSGIKYVSKDDFNNFKFTNGYSLDTKDDFHNCYKWIEQIKEKQNINPYEEIKGKFISDFYYQELQQKKALLNQEGYEKWLDEMLEYRLNLDNTPEEIKEELRLECPYEQYIEYTQADIDNYQSKIDDQEKQFLEFEEKLKIVFSKDPLLEDNLRSLSYMDRSHIYDYVYEISDDNIDDVIQKIVTDLKEVKTYSVTDYLKEDITQQEKRELGLLESMQALDEKPIEECIEEFITGYKVQGRSKTMDDWFKDHSAPVELNKTAAALREILKKTHKELSQQDIYDYIHGIVDFACENISYHYKKTASNALVQRAIQLREERELTT